MIEDEATERWKKRAQKLGLIVNAGVDKSKPKHKTNSKDRKVSVKPNKKGTKR